ncbi:MAG TPA: hypothetical protein VIG47_08570 [Gemmatimonadaceae bacterium]|jgi:hypothetical protein
MYAILITSENGIPYLHESVFTYADDARSACRELSRDYNQSLIRLYRLGEKLAIAHYRNGALLDA